MSNDDGCLTWLSRLVSNIVVLAALAGGHVENFVPRTPTLAPTPQVAEANTLIVSIPEQATNAPFSLENNDIIYVHSETFGTPCYYEMAGRVLDMEGQPFSDYVVNIKMLDEYAPELGYAYPGPIRSEWSSLLPQAPVVYEVWLTSAISGDELSPHILVYPQTCDYNKAIINFVQVNALS